MTLLWQSVTAALIPIAISDLPLALLAFLKHLRRQTRSKRPRSAAVFQANFRAVFG